VGDRRATSNDDIDEGKWRSVTDKGYDEGSRNYCRSRAE
jgi:hypothetical protein